MSDGSAGEVPVRAEPDQGRVRRRATGARGGVGTVRLAGSVMSLAQLRAEPGRFARLFDRARTVDGAAFCLCHERGHRLVIRLRNGRFYLARWPSEADLHDAACDFYRAPDRLSGRSTYTVGAIVEGPDGTAIRLHAPLKLRKSSAARELAERSAEPAPGSETRQSVRLLGLLHHLWEHARLNTHSPASGRRGWGDCHAAVTAVAEETSVNGQPLGKALYVVPPWRRNHDELIAAQYRLFTARLGTHAAGVHRGLILGEVKAITPTQYGSKFLLRHHRDPIYVSADLLERLRRGHRSALSDGRPRTARQVGLWLVDRSAKGYLRVAGAAVMLTCRNYIPADSSYEVMMSEHLARAGRAFAKPLRYDSAVDAVFPDFVLLDTAPSTYVEVWGITGREDYERRKRVKQAHYQQVAAPLIEWNIRDELPAVARPLSAGGSTSSTV